MTPKPRFASAAKGAVEIHRAPVGVRAAYLAVLIEEPRASLWITDWHEFLIAVPSDANMPSITLAISRLEIAEWRSDHYGTLSAGKRQEIHYLSGIIGVKGEATEVVNILEMASDSEPPIEQISHAERAKYLTETAEALSATGSHAKSVWRLRELLVDELERADLEATENLQASLGFVAIAAEDIRESQNQLDHWVERARTLGASWTDIANTVGITSQAAYRRWDPEAKRKHREYQRNRRTRENP